jgi:SAM-dependent methyltransferase
VAFEAEWLADRGPYDEAALDRGAIAEIRRWGATFPRDRSLVVVDLGSGAGAALDRVVRWLAPRRIAAYAVDQDAALLARATPGAGGGAVIPLVGDLLTPLDLLGGPPDGTVDLVVGHALADLVPLDRLASRAAALVRPGGLVHVALAYDGLTFFTPAADDDDLEQAMIAAFHRHMDRPTAEAASYGGSTAGRRLGPALKTAGLEIVSDRPSTWVVRAVDGVIGRRVLSRLIPFVVEAAREVGGVSTCDLERWEVSRREALIKGTLVARVGHRDVLARAANSRSAPKVEPSLRPTPNLCS